MSDKINEYCANSTKELRCPRHAVTGHIYCLPCRLQTGGYNRYNPHVPKAHTHSKPQQEI